MTIGHSNRALAELVGLLKANGVDLLADVRSMPRSRHNPQFNQETLPETLEEAGIGYVHLPQLGGMRRPRPDSRNTGWKNASFRGYADYMQTPEFEAALENLMRLEGDQRVAIMCAEAVPWRCHRSLISDALMARGVGVSHIMSMGSNRGHELTSFARVIDGRVDYPGLW
uniref:Uncharacterized protein n=1 Tax=Solibacter usitatus (strain Ellin6076) TaxID=234267 RepID=Q01NH8_SOLUE